LLLLVVSVMLMIADYKQDYLERLRSALSLVVYPLQYLVNLPIELGKQVKGTMLTRQALTSENERLRRQNLLLKSRSQKFAAVESENMRLRELLESSLEAGERVLLAGVVSIEQDPTSRQVILDKGSKQGVYLGQPIIDAHGVMGQVIHVGPISCIGLLITDSSHALPVQINRNGIRAIATGTGSSDGLEVAYVPQNADVKQGDLLVSSGIDGRFPAGYPVGEVTRIEVNPGEPFAKISAVPTAQFHQAQEVLLVWPPEDLVHAVDQAMPVTIAQRE
jgi:rod shape-determining protein MreC